jgi:hypothetical protein
MRSGRLSERSVDRIFQMVLKITCKLPMGASIWTVETAMHYFWSDCLVALAAALFPLVPWSLRHRTPGIRLAPARGSTWLRPVAPVCTLKLRARMHESDR